MSKTHGIGGKTPSGSGKGEAGGAPEPGKSTLTSNLKSAGAPGNPAGAMPADEPVAASTGPVKLKVENDKKSPSGSNARKTVGVGERIFVTNEPVTDGKFSCPVGTGKDESTLYTWDAPDTATKAVITFTPEEKGATPSTVEINVIEPEKVEFQDKTELSYGNVSAAGMKVKVAFLPFTVSFRNLDWQEKDVEPSAVEGWFTKQPANKLKHIKGAGGYLDDKNKATDKAEWRSDVVVKEKSKLQWDIPQHYKVNGGAEKPVPSQPFTQLMTIDADGTTTVSKNGQSVTRKVPGGK
ncbi:MAG: hypothetical protein JNL83_16545 [Myxococcales bacterium]|nr:hypothetical protein [Myxococcales bacterium]